MNFDLFLIFTFLLIFEDLHFSYFYLYTFNNDSLIKEQCSRISISCYPWQVNYGHGKVDFQTFDFVVRGQVNFNYWIEEFLSNDFKTFSFAQLYKWRIILFFKIMFSYEIVISSLRGYYSLGEGNMCVVNMCVQSTAVGG